MILPVLSNRKKAHSIVLVTLAAMIAVEVNRVFAFKNRKVPVPFGINKPVKVSIRDVLKIAVYEYPVGVF